MIQVRSAVSVSPDGSTESEEHNGRRSPLFPDGDLGDLSRTAAQEEAERGGDTGTETEETRKTDSFNSPSTGRAQQFREQEEDVEATNQVVWVAFLHSKEGNAFVHAAS